MGGYEKYCVDPHAPAQSFLPNNSSAECYLPGFRRHQNYTIVLDRMGGKNASNKKNYGGISMAAELGSSELRPAMSTGHLDFAYFAVSMNP
jgi:hypothetical protein